MKLREVLSLLMCIECQGEILETPGKLVCQKCQKEYPVEKGVIQFLHEGEPQKYEIPWHPVESNASFFSKLKRKISILTAKVPFLQFLVSKLLHGPNKFFLIRKVKGYIDSSGIILDVGCRNIPYAKEVSKKTFIALDIDGPSLEYVASLGLPDVIPIHASIERLPFKKNSIDFINCIEVIEHVQKDHMAIEEIGRVLKRGGQLFLTTPDGESLPLESLPEPRLHLRHYKPQEIIEMVGPHFSEIKLIKIVSFFNFWKISDGIETRYRNENVRLLKVAYLILFVAANFFSNIIHMILERTRYASHGHLRLILECRK